MHTNRIEFFQGLLKRGYHGTCPKASGQCLSQYLWESTARLNQRDLDTPDQMEALSDGLVGRCLAYPEL